MHVDGLGRIGALHNTAGLLGFLLCIARVAAGIHLNTVAVHLLCTAQHLLAHIHFHLARAFGIGLRHVGTQRLALFRFLLLFFLLFLFLLGVVGYVGRLRHWGWRQCAIHQIRDFLALRHRHAAQSLHVLLQVFQIGLGANSQGNKVTK